MEIAATDLAEFPGAPFLQKHVDAVVAKLERVLGWHVAPLRTETLTVHSRGGRFLFLPSRQVAEVTAVRRGRSAVGDWSLTGQSEAMLRGWWAEDTYEVDLTHGFEDVPADLLGEIAKACVAFRTDPSLASWSSGPFSATLRPGHGGSKRSATLLAYAVDLGV